VSRGRKLKDYPALFNAQALAKAHELPGEPHSPKREPPEDVRGIFRIGREILKEIRDLKDISGRPNVQHKDMPFDILTSQQTPENPAAVGLAYPLTILNLPIGNTEKIIIQQFCFFSTVQTAPVIPDVRNILAEPMEYMLNYRYRILSGVSGISRSRNFFDVATYGGGGSGGLHDGYIALTQDPASFDPQQCTRIELPPGKPLVVTIELIAALIVNQRIPLRHGCRIRGIIRPVT
jgi:hypothetical protein